MINFRKTNLALVLLLALSGSGLQMLCAPCAEAAAPMACHAGMQAGDGQGGAWQAAGCCCLLDESAADYAPYVLAVEPVYSAVVQPGRVVAVELPLHAVAPPSPRAHALHARPPLFQLHCSFLI